MRQPVYKAIASRLAAMANCAESGNSVWQVKHANVAAELTRDHMPSGSGFDNGTKLNMDRSTPEKLVFDTAFHHMDESGCYDGWTDHVVTVRPSLVYTVTLTISGKDRNGIKDHIHEAFHAALLELERLRETSDGFVVEC